MTVDRAPDCGRAEYRAAADDGPLPYSNEDTSPEYGNWRSTEAEARQDAEAFGQEHPAYERIWIQKRAVAGPPSFHADVRSQSGPRSPSVDG